MARTAVKAKENYFVGEKDVSLVSSGCAVLDCALGGGFAEGRVINIIGDKSSGKTLLSIELCANYTQKHRTAQIYYVESESAFDKGYAAALGLPLEHVSFAAEDTKGVDDAVLTVEGLFEYIEAVIAETKKCATPALVVIDSLDAFSDREEKKRKIDEGSYGANKAKKMSEMFRRVITDLEAAQITTVFVSQIRDNIGVTFGKKTTRSGGRALDFYCSQVIEIAQIGQIKKMVQNVERVSGVNVRAKITKNKVGLPFREAEYSMLFGYGVDDVKASLDWLGSIKDTAMAEQLGIKNLEKLAVTRFMKKLMVAEDEEFYGVRDKITAYVKKRWNEIEQGFLPTRRKYR